MVMSADRAGFDTTVLDYATELATAARSLLDRKRAARTAHERRTPLDAYRVRELAEMSHDIFENRNGFAQARRAFLTHQAATPTVSGLPTPRFPADQAAPLDRSRAGGGWSALTAKLAAIGVIRAPPRAGHPNYPRASRGT
jgi:hypothetical protein